MGGWWRGVLFDDPAVWLAPTFTWTFTFLYADVAREGGRAAPSLTVSGVRLAAAGWHAMAGQRAACQGFGQPVESTIHYLEHHRYRSTDLHVVRQQGRLLQVIAEVDGDLDGLGIEAMRASSRLLFDGIAVDLVDGPPDVAAARAMLDDFTDTTGLEGYARAHGFWFTPTG